MKNSIISLNIFFIILLPLSQIYSQIDTVNIYALPELRIKQKENGKEITYLFENRLNKITLTPAKIYPDTNKYRYKVNLKDIRFMYIRNGSSFWDVAAITGTVGYVLGFLGWGFFTLDGPLKFHFDRAVYGGIFVGVPFALIGGLIGLFFNHYDEYDLNNMNEKQKYEELKRIFEINKVKPHK